MVACTIERMHFKTMMNLLLNYSHSKVLVCCQFPLLLFIYDSIFLILRFLTQNNPFGCILVTYKQTNLNFSTSGQH